MGKRGKIGVKTGHFRHDFRDVDNLQSGFWVVLSVIKMLLFPLLSTI